jgi:hypothetical protein
MRDHPMHARELNGGMWGGVKMVGNAGKKLVEMAGEKSLPGQQRALYGTELGANTSFFGGAVVKVSI